jgi:Cu-processing system ATP-binding protein
MIEIKGLKKKFGRLEVLNGIDLSIQEGLTTAILGPNGSGKTTLIKSILGMVRPSEGDILWNDQSVLGAWKYREQIGYLPQIARFPENLSVKELISFVENLRSQPGEYTKLIEIFGLEEFLNKKLRFLSGGTRQKVNLLLTFMFDCQLYILDEPTSGLDPVALLHFKGHLAQLKQAGKTILITTHIINIVEEVSDELIFLLEGNIFYKGSYLGLMEDQNEENLEKAIAKILMGNHVENTEI